MKKKMFIMILLVILLSSCQQYPNAGKRPCDFPGTMWVSEDPYICLDVSREPWKNTNSEENGYIYGEALVDGKMIEVEVWFPLPNGIIIRDRQNGERYIYGECDFSSKKVEININKDDYTKDSLYNSKYEKIVLSRTRDG